MKNSVATNFPFLSDQIIRQLADSAVCDPAYVRMILRGDREAKSVRAKAILKTAKKINTQMGRIKTSIKIQVVEDAD